MLIKTIIVFLAGMALLAMLGGAIVKASGRPLPRLGVAKIKPCPHCGKRDVGGAVLGRKTCGCGSR